MKTIQLHQKDWVEIFPEALWAYQTTWHNTTGFTPYDLVYGKYVVFLIEFEVKTLCIELQSKMDLTKAQQHCLNQINELDDFRQVFIQQTDIIQRQRAKWHDQFIKKKKFYEGDWALLFDSWYKYF